MEAALWIAMATLVFLAKDNPRLVYPDALHFFVVLLVSSLATSALARYRPDRRGLHALSILASYAATAGLVGRSGGAESTLWVLYLLPLFTSAILLEGRETGWVAAGACAANATAYLVEPGPWGASWTFELCLKTGVLGGAAGAAWLLSRAEREAGERLRRQRVEIAGLERSLHDAEAAREQARGLAAIAGLGAAAVHDLSTPLMVIRGYVRVHLEGGELPETLARDFARVDRAAAFCQELVARLLTRDAETPSDYPVATMAQTALALAEPVLAQRRVSLCARLPDDGVTVHVVRRDVERILMNLLSNAGKILSPGGTVTVAARGAESGGRPWVEVCVEDDGPGLDPAILPRLFQPFATTRAGSGGTGLGLYLSREAARRFGGDLTAENLPRGGARFVLRLPVTARIPAAEKPATAPA